MKLNEKFYIKISVSSYSYTFEYCFHLYLSNNVSFIERNKFEFKENRITSIKWKVYVFLFFFFTFKNRMDVYEIKHLDSL